MRRQRASWWYFALKSAVVTTLLFQAVFCSLLRLLDFRLQIFGETEATFCLTPEGSNPIPLSPLARLWLCWCVEYFNSTILYIDSGVLVTIHNESTVRTLMGTNTQGLWSNLTTSATGLSCVLRRDRDYLTTSLCC